MCSLIEQLLYIRNHFAEDVGLPTIEDSTILQGAARIQEQQQIMEETERKRQERLAEINFRFDPNSTADVCLCE